MPAPRQGQSNAMLNSLITFVALFIIATVAAIVCYVKLDEAKTIADNETRSRRELADDQQQRQAATIVGSKEDSESYFGAVVNKYNRLYQLVTGKIPEEGKSIESANEQLMLNVKRLKGQFEGNRFDDASILPMIVAMKSEYDAAKAKVQSLTAELEDVKSRWSRDVENFATTEEKLVAEKNMFIAQATDAQKSVSDIKDTAMASVQRRIDQLSQQLEQANNQLEESKQQISQLQASLNESETTRRRLEMQIEEIKPRPDIEVAAYKPDGKIVSVDQQLGIVYLNMGSNDRVYRGLTFAVYDKTAPIPEDGKGKAEIRIFDVRSEVSVARIISGGDKTPVIPDDIIVNLIWDSKVPNTFVVVGQFDLDGDGVIDINGNEKVTNLIRSWGGIVTETLDINTDFVVLGAEPEITGKPSDAEVSLDPLALDRYNQAIETATEYKAVRDKAAGLSIPVFNTERFKNLIGYNAEAAGDKPF